MAMQAGAATITFTIDPTQNNNVISPYIYGSNSAIPGVKNTYFRSGGNRLSAYNWETNWSNAGSDYLYENDTLMGTKADGPGWAYTTFHTQNKTNGADSLVTIPMAGYVSANGEPAVQVPAADYMTAPGLTDPHGNFFPISFVKPGYPGSYADPPNLTDGAVYDDEMVNFLVKHLGASTAGGIKFYDLDNEPGAWSSTHQEVHNYPVSYIEVASKAITVALQTTAIDPGAQILGPVGYGWGDFINLSGAPDHATYDATYNNGNWVSFLNYYLATMHTASTAAGRRLLHYLDSHVYSEGTDAAGNRINNNDVSQDAATTRMQLPREMWDPTFTENNWISCCVAYGPMTLIPRLQAAINQYYPGTNIAFTEYDYGGGGDISGGIAQADFLGVLTKYPNMMASIWDVGAGDQYLTCAFNFYLNYDGAGTHFGDTSVLASSSNVPEATVYAAKDSAHPNHLNVIVLNKDYTNNNTASVTLSNLGGASISAIRAFRFDSAISVITASTAPAFTANSFTDTLPFRSATLYELTLSTSFVTSTPTATSSFTSTATPTSTATSTPTGTLPTATSTPTRTATPTATSSPTATVVCVNLFNNCDGLTANGTWSGTNATRSINTTPADLTQGTGSLQVAVATGATWNDQMFNLNNFTPSNWTGVSQLMLDVYVPASLLAGTTYNNLYLFASSSAVGENSISADGPSLVAGWNNNLTFNIDFTQGAITPGSALIELFFIFSSSGTNTGTLYVDNIRLVQSCAPTPTPTGSTSTPISSPTRTATATGTNTLTMTPSFTPSRTPTWTATLTPSSTPTLSPTPSPSRTPTSSPTNSVTATPSQTATSSATPSSTNTLGNTATNTPSSTFTWSSTASPTPSLSSTPTMTKTPTPSWTPTNSPSVTPTHSATLTPTGTATPTISFTPTDSPTGTLSPSLTPTFSPTPTLTGTHTSTATPSGTYTATPTFTLTNSPTSTPTASRTPTASLTVTPSASRTATGTFSSTPTNTLVNTATNTGTPTRTETSTATNTGVNTATPSGTASGTPTVTLTSTPTSSFTPIPCNLNIASGTVTLTSGTYNLCSLYVATGANLVIEGQVFLNVAGNVDVEGIITGTGYGFPPGTSDPGEGSSSPLVVGWGAAGGGGHGGAGASGKNGALDPGSPGGTVTDSPTQPTLEGGGGGNDLMTGGTGGAGGAAFILAAGGSVTLNGAIHMDGVPGTGSGGGGGAGGTLSIDGTGIYGSGSLSAVGSNSGGIGGGGGGGRVRICDASGTSGGFTGSVNVSASGGGLSFMGGSAGSYYNCNPTPTPTLTAIYTSTPTVTWTASPTTTPQSAVTQVVLYPNPADGNGPIYIALPITQPSEVKIQVFTTAFRKVQEKNYPSQPVGVPIQLELLDQSGAPLANGLYYVVIQTPVGKTVEKLLILR